MKRYKGEEVKHKFLLKNGLLVVVVPQKLSDDRSGETSCSRVEYEQHVQLMRFPRRMVELEGPHWVDGASFLCVHSSQLICKSKCDYMGLVCFREMETQSRLCLGAFFFYSESFLVIRPSGFSYYFASPWQPFLILFGLHLPSSNYCSSVSPQPLAQPGNLFEMGFINWLPRASLQV